MFTTKKISTLSKRPSCLDFARHGTLTMVGLVLLISFFSFTSLIASDKKTLTANNHVKVEIHSPAHIPLTKNGILKFFLTPNDGIHINTEPMFELTLDKSSNFELAGNPRFSKNEKGYLDFTKPIEYTVKAKNGVQPGKHSLKATLYYFYCSDQEGWCNRFSQPVDLTITVTR
ncbi:MAG: hypothetical protein AB1600_04110 [Bacteroidota bacterium]